MEIRDLVAKMAAALVRQRRETIAARAKPSTPIIRASLADVPLKRPPAPYRPKPPSRPCSNM